MPRYFNADALKWRYIPLTIQPEEFVTKSDIENAPTADVRENVHAKWEDRYKNGDWHCTNCGAIIEKDEQINHVWNFCYHCGAVMDEGRTDENG